MSAGVSVAASGSALAFLLYENVSSRNNQAGYILGDVVSEKKSLISDADIGEETTETVIHVHTFVEVRELCSLYKLDNYKRISTDAMGNVKKNIVGWYSFRRNVTAVPTLRDRYLHSQLLQIFGRSDHFLFCLLTSSENSDNRTYSFRQHFLIYSPITRKYEAIPLLIENLANISQHYREKLPPTSGKLMQSLIEKSGARPDGSDLVNKLQSKLTKELNVAVRELLFYEGKIKVQKRTVQSLREDRDNVLKRRQERMLRKPSIGDKAGQISRKHEREISGVDVDVKDNRGDYCNKDRYSLKTADVMTTHHPGKRRCHVYLPNTPSLSGVDVQVNTPRNSVGRVELVDLASDGEDSVGPTSPVLGAIGSKRNQPNR